MSTATSRVKANGNISGLIFTVSCFFVDSDFSRQSEWKHRKRGDYRLFTVMMAVLPGS
ncbi:MAG: hypothetical protein ACK5MT_04675 [Actinomycetales bacterium]